MLYTIIWALIAVLYGPIFYVLYQGRWELIDYTHAYFILPASLFLVWFNRQHLPKADAPTPRCVRLSLTALVVGLLLFWVGWRNDYVFILSISLLPVLMGLVGYLYGAKTLRVLSFPILYLIFLIPPPLGVLDAITVPMRYGASVMAETLLRSFDLPVSREGLLLFLGKQEIFIAPACSGFRSLITFLALAFLYIQFIPASFKKKSILILSVFPLAFIGNLIRVIILCLITYFFGEEVGQGFLHEFSGILVFLFIVSGFILIDKLYDEDEE